MHGLLIMVKTLALKALAFPEESTDHILRDILLMCTWLHLLDFNFKLEFKKLSNVVETQVNFFI